MIFSRVFGRFKALQKIVYLAYQFKLAGVVSFLRYHRGKFFFKWPSFSSRPLMGSQQI